MKGDPGGTSNADTLRVPGGSYRRNDLRAPTIATDALPLPLRLRFAIAMRSPAHLVASIVAVSAVVRGVVAWQHTTPRYFPDEYIYATLGRSIGHLGFDIRGGIPHFPPILEPVLAAPLWAAFSPATAYHLVQLENAVFMSLAAVPAYLIARRLSLSPGWSVACAAYAVAIPAFTLTAYVMSDPVGYPLALGAVAAAIDAIDRPGRRAQIAFVALATLASLGRIQYVVLFVAYAVAALAVSRRSVLRDHRVVAGTMGLGAAAVVAAGPQRILGYYAGILNLHVGGVAATWFATHAFLVTLAAGVTIIPGAVALLVGPRGRAQTAYAVFVATFAALLLVEASLYAANGEGRFKERYVFVLLPLLAIAFAAWVQNGKQRRGTLVLVAGAIVVAVARLPLSQYATASAKADSQFLFSMGFGQDKLGVATMSLAAALVATALAVWAVLAGPGRRAAGSFAIALAVAIGSSAAAAYVDINVTNAVRQGIPSAPSWVDEHATGQVTAIATPFSSSTDLISMLFWNPSVTREVVLRGAFPTDAFAVAREGVLHDGTLPRVHGDVLINTYGTTVSLQAGRLLAAKKPFFLWHSDRPLSFGELLAGRFEDGWLNSYGVLRAWPRHRGRAVELSFRLSLPNHWSKSPVHLHLNGVPLNIRAGERVDVTCRSAAGRLQVPFSSSDAVFDTQFRRLSVRMTQLRLADVPRSPGAPVSSCTSSR